MSTTSAPSPRGSTEKERRAGVGDEAAAGAAGEESAKTAAGSAPAEEEERKIDVVMESEECATFTLYDEDHTLGNSLRWLLSQQPDVEFCGYSMPHPSELKVNLRIQTRKGASAVRALDQALSDLQAMATHMLSAFDEACAEYDERSQQSAMDTS